MKIAVVVGTFPKLSETFVLNHIIGLIKNGNEVTIFSTDKGTPPFHPNVIQYNLIDKAIYRANPHVGTFKRAMAIIKLLWQNKHFILKLIKTLRPKYYGSFALKGYFLFEAIPFLKFKPNYFDIIHAHFGENGNKMAYLKEIGILTSPLVINFHGHDVNHIELVKKQNYYKAVDQFANALIFNSNYLKNKFKKITKTQIQTYQIPVGVDTNLFNKELNNINALRYPIKIITVGRLVDCKGINLVLQSLAKTERLNFEYHIIGDGPNKESIHQLANNLNIGSKVFLHGALTQPQLIKEIQKSNLFILFGVTDKNGEIDAQGLVVQEAQSCGIPAIVSDGGGLPEGILNNETGFIIKEGDVTQLTKLLLSILDDNIILEQMSLKTRNFIINNYALEVIESKINQVYTNTLN